MARLLFLTFFGEFRGGPDAEHHVHESPVVDAGAARAPRRSAPRRAGFVKIPHIVQPVLRLPEEAAHHVAWLPAVATLSGVLGILIAWYLYLSMPDLRASLASALRPALRVFEAKYWFDDVYDAFVRRVVVGGSDRSSGSGSTRASSTAR